MKIKATDAINGIVGVVLEEIPEISKKEAKELVIESLVYRCVVEEIVGQVDFLYNNKSCRLVSWDDIGKKPTIPPKTE